VSKEPAGPLRGEAAWKAEKKRISDRNEAAYARGREERAARNVQFAKDRRVKERREDSNLPEQPHG
jgi:hypothetical protein